MKAIRKIFQRLFSVSMAVGALQESGLQYWRERVFGFALQAMLVFGLIALIPSVWLAIHANLYIVAVADTIAYVLVLSLFFLRHRMRYEYRAGFMLVVGLAVGLVVFYFTGDKGGGFFWMFMIPPLASVLLGLQVGFFFFVLNFIFIIITGYLVALGTTWLPGLVEFNIASWGVYAVNSLVTSALITFPLGALLNGLFETTKREKQTVEDFRIVFQNNPLPMWVYEVSSLRFLAVNDAAIDHYGYTGDEFLAMTIKDVRPPSELLALEANLSSPSPKDRQYSGPWKHKKKDGSIIDVEIYSHSIKFANKDARLVLANDVTDLMQSQLELREREELYRILAENSQTLICTHDLVGKILSVNDVAVQLTGYSRDQILKMNLNELIAPGWRKFFPRYLSRLIRLGKVRGLMQIQTSAGEIRTWEYNNVMWTDENEQHLVRGMATDITARLRTQEQLKLSDQILQRVKSIVLVIDREGSIIYVSPSSEEMIGYPAEQLMGNGWWKISRNDAREAEVEKALLKRIAMGEIPLRSKPYETSIKSKSGDFLWIEWLDVMGPNKTVIGVGRDVTQQREAERATRQRLAELEAIRDVSTSLREAERVEEMLPLLLDSTLRVLNMDKGSVWLYKPAQDHLEMAVVRGYQDEQGKQIQILPQKPGEGISGFVYSSGSTFQSDDFGNDPRIPEYTRILVPPKIGGAAVPIRSESGILGVLFVNVDLPRVVEDHEIDLLTTIAEVAGNAMQRSSLHQKTRQQLNQFRALSEIDHAILSNLDLQYNLRLLVENVVNQLGVDAANVMLYNSELQTLESVRGTGFLTVAFERRILELGEGNAGKVAAKREIIHIEHLEAQTDNPRLAKALVAEKFTDYYGVPLIAKGEVRGVLEIFNRSPLAANEEWIDLLKSLASRTALAIDTIKTLENLERSNQDLVLSYDATIEGWSKALDLRDKETEGHSQRVAGLGLELARRIGLDQKQLVNFRRGALLHDIGKMGVPDNILFKPASLNEKEWSVMKQHTIFAQEMLQDIGYLKDAIDIPYAHHERWDGSGYPLGLKGESIPLAARIFAVVDVYDALTSDRPYRKAWAREKTLSYIKEESGRLFDPQVVEVFLKHHLATKSLESEKSAML